MVLELLPFSQHLLCSTDACAGWISAAAAALSWGSFGVPIKSGACDKVDVDPLVMQSYKSTMCFITSWLVLLMGEKASFTPWGIASGIFWVPGGTAGIYAIRTIGLAVSVGTWSSIIVMVSFVVGIFVFGEGVKNVIRATLAALVLVAGIGGMSRYSRDEEGDDEQLRSNSPPSSDTAEVELVNVVGMGSGHAENTGDTSSSDGGGVASGIAVTAAKKRVIAASTTSEDEHNLETESLISRSDQGAGAGEAKAKGTPLLRIGGISLSRRQSGFMGACFNGVWGGSMMLPLHFAREEGFGGLGFVISFATGSMLITMLMWVVRYSFHVYKTRSLSEACYALPSFHLKQLWFYGALAGILYSIGNLCSILSVTYLGQGVGYSVVQSAMLISGLWGIFFYGEIRNKDMICKWLTAAIVTMTGILWLSYEHEGGLPHR